jgi:hypothetical protein
VSESWPPGRTEEELLDGVYRRARALRIRRRASAGGVVSVVAAAALVPILLLHPGQPTQAVNTAGQTANPTASSVRTSTSGSTSLPGGRDQGGGPTGAGSSPGRPSATPGGGPVPGTRPGWVAPKPTTPGTNQTGGSSPATVLSGPQVTSVDPAYGPTSGGTKVTISGVDLQDVTEVVFGSVTSKTFTVQSATTIVAISPPAAQPGMVPIGVYNDRHQGHSDATCWGNPLCSDGFLYTPASVWGKSPILPVPGLEQAADGVSDLKAKLGGR